MYIFKKMIQLTQKEYDIKYYLHNVFFPTKSLINYNPYWLTNESYVKQQKHTSIIHELKPINEWMSDE